MDVWLLAGEMLPDVDRAPLSQAARKDNTEKVLQYMIARKIRMHETTAEGESERCVIAGLSRCSAELLCIVLV